MKKKLFVTSLGCPKNSVDSEVFIHEFSSFNYELTDNPTNADVLLCNTCSFIQDAKQESIDEIFSLIEVKNRTNAKLVVAGCLAQRYANELIKEIPEIDVLVGTGGIDKTLEALNFSNIKPQIIVPKQRVFLNSYDQRGVFLTPPYFTYIKIADGCSRQCSYCAIPLIKGRQMSRTIESIKQEISLLTKSRVLKEAILVAQDSTAFGDDLKNGSSLASLINALSEIEQPSWLRLLYMYPDRINQELLNAIKNNSACLPYFDIPIQHISKSVLKSMRRGTTPDRIKNVLSTIRSFFPESVIRSTFIIGYPGETESDFIELLDFIEEYKIDNVGAFTYSDEEGTAAALLPNKIEDNEKQERFDEFISLQMDISEENLKKYVGKKLKILCTGFDEEQNMYKGRFWGQAPEIDGEVFFTVPENKKIKSGTFVSINITDNKEYDLFGEQND